MKLCYILQLIFCIIYGIDFNGAGKLCISVSFTWRLSINWTRIIFFLTHISYLNCWWQRCTTWSSSIYVRGANSEWKCGKPLWLLHFIKFVYPYSCALYWKVLTQNLFKELDFNNLANKFPSHLILFPSKCLNSLPIQNARILVGTNNLDDSDPT